MYTGLLKEYFNQIVNKDINFVKLTPIGRGSGKSITSLCCAIMIWFKRDHPVISKIPFINWIIFKRYLNKKLCFSDNKAKISNKVELVFDEEIIALAGDGYGLKTYIDQVHGKINVNEKFIIKFPERIRILSTHFVSGFINGMIDYNLTDINIIRKNICIEGNPRFVEQFINILN